MIFSDDILMKNEKHAEKIREVFTMMVYAHGNEEHHKLPEPYNVCVGL